MPQTAGAPSRGRHGARLAGAGSASPCARALVRPMGLRNRRAPKRGRPRRPKPPGPRERRRARPSKLGRRRTPPRDTPVISPSQRRTGSRSQKVMELEASAEQVACRGLRPAPVHVRSREARCCTHCVRGRRRFYNRPRVKCASPDRSAKREASKSAHPCSRVAHLRSFARGALVLSAAGTTVALFVVSALRRARAGEGPVGSRFPFRGCTSRTG